MKTTQMVFRKLSVGEKTKPTDYQMCKEYEEEDSEVRSMHCILDKPSLWVSNWDGHPLANLCNEGTPSEVPSEGNDFFRRI